MLLDRVAGAPISWGVSEVPGWGYQLEPDRVLAEMREIGLAATELGPAGFLPTGPIEQAALLGSYGLTLAGAFVPVVLHDAAHDAGRAVMTTLAKLSAADGPPGMLVLAADSGQPGYDRRTELDEAGWATLFVNLRRIQDRAAAARIPVALHPHVGTVIERAEEVDRIVADSTIPLCLDTGHLLIGGTDPAELASRATGRIAHVHLKDVDAAAAAEVRGGRLGYADAVAAGLYRPLGSGDVDVADIVRTLESAGYGGWYVLEQDTVLTGDPPAGAGPAADVRASVAYLAALAPPPTPADQDRDRDRDGGPSTGGIR